MIERDNPLCSIFGWNLRRTASKNLFYCSLFCCRWIVYSIRRSTVTDGGCKDNSSKDPFSQCENQQNLHGIHVQVKSEYVGTLTTSEVMTRMQSDKHNNMFSVASNLKHVNTHKNNNWRLVSALSLFVCSVSSLLLVLSSSVAQFLAYMIDHTVAQVCALFVSSSSPCLMRTLSDPTSPST